MQKKTHQGYFSVTNIQLIAQNFTVESHLQKRCYCRPDYPELPYYLTGVIILTKTLPSQAPSLHRNNSVSGAKEVEVFYWRSLLLIRYDSYRMSHT